jgi:hypothetical protein
MDSRPACQARPTGPCGDCDATIDMREPGDHGNARAALAFVASEYVPVQRNEFLLEEFGGAPVRLWDETSVVGTPHASGCDVATAAYPQRIRDDARRLLEIAIASPAFALLRAAW